MSKALKTTMKPAPEFSKVPTVGDMFFDQYKQLPAVIYGIDVKDVTVKYRNGLHTFRLRELAWDNRAGWWRFKEESKRYHVWMEIAPAESSEKRRGVWEKACALPMSRVTAEAMCMMLKNEKPEIEFSVSIGKPSSYFL